MSSPDIRRELGYGEAIREAISQEMERDTNVILFGMDVDDHKAILGSTEGLREIYGSERVFSTPLSEDAMTGVAIGAAMAGLRPIHVHIRMDFLTLCANQLINMAAKSRYMFGGAVKVPMVVRSIIGKSWGQGPQHSQSLYSLFAHIPGLIIVAPSNAHDAKGCMISAIRNDNPVLFVEHRMLYYTRAFVQEAPFEQPLGRARVCAVGDDITIVGISNMVVECLRVREILAHVGISSEVIDPISLAPLDIETILESARRTGRLLIVDNAWTSCGMSAEIAARVAESLYPSEQISIQRMGFAPVTCPTTSSLEKVFYPNPTTISQKAYAMVRPESTGWQPKPDQAELAYQREFKGPF